MTPETLATTDMSRFTNSENDLVAFEATVIVALAAYIMFLHWMYGRQFKELKNTLDVLGSSVPTLTEAVHNVSKT